MLAEKYIALHLWKFMLLWLGTGIVVAGMVTTELLFWSGRGWRYSPKAAIEDAVLVDLATTNRGKPIAKIRGLRTRDAARSLGVFIEVEGVANCEETIRFGSSLDAYRIAMSDEGTLAVLTRRGEIHLAKLSLDMPPVLELLCICPGTRELDFSPDGKLLAAMGHDGYSIWNVETNQEVLAEWPNEGTRFLDFFHDSQALLEATSSCIQTRQLATGEISSQMETNCFPNTAAVSPNDRFALLSSDGFRVRMWDLVEERELWRANSHSSRRSHLAVGDECSFYIAPNSKDVISRNTRTGQVEKVVVSFQHAIHSMALQSNEGLLSWDLRAQVSKTNH